MKKKILISLTVLILIAGGVLTYFYITIDNQVEKLLREKFINKNNEDPNTRYYIDFEKLDFNIFSGSLEVDGITITPKDSVVLLKTMAGDLPHTAIKMHVDKFQFIGFKYARYFERNIMFQTLNIIEPDLFIGIRPNAATEESPTDTVDVRSIFLAAFDSINCNEVHIEEGSLMIVNLEKEDTIPVLEVNHFSTSYYNVTVNRQTLHSPRFVHYDRFEFMSEGFQIELGGSALLKVADIEILQQDTTLILRGVDYRPIDDKETFMKKRKWRVAWIHFAADEVTIKHINSDTLIINKKLFAKSVHVSNPYFDVHADPVIPIDPNRYLPFLGEIVKQIALPLDIDSLEATGGMVNFTLRGKKTRKVGRITFEDMRVSATNITNIPEVLAENKYLHMHVVTKPNGSGVLVADFNFDQLDPLAGFKLDATGKNIDPTTYNPMLVPIMNAKILTGKVHSLNLDVYANRVNAKGTIDLHLTDLSYEILKKNSTDENDPKANNKFMSFMANTFVKTENIPGDINYQQGKIELDFQPHEYPFFKYVWEFTRVGLMNALTSSSDKKAFKKQQRQAAKAIRNSEAPKDAKVPPKSGHKSKHHNKKEGK